MPSLAALALIPTPQRLSSFDLSLVAVYLIGITLFGLSFRKKSGTPAKSLQSYFLADNTIPWWAIALSIVSAETSTLTIISIPGVAFTGDFTFLQLVLGYLLGRIVVAALFLPQYFSGKMLTAYQLIDQRFGPTLHKVTAGLFLLTRAAAEGVRVFAVSIVVGIAIGTGDVLSIAIISALTLLYTFEGGMAAVIWTDVVQMAIYIAGTFIALWSLGHHVPGGWSHIYAVAQPAGKFHLFNFAFNLTTTYTFWAGILGGTFLTMASHGTDQLMVQRMLAARNLRESRLALLTSGAVIFLQFTLFLLIGAGLYVFYKTPGPWTLNPGPLPSPDRIFPTFIVHNLPIGIAGLLVAAILAAAMSNLSAALNSLSSTTVVDFYMHWRPQADPTERNLIAKSSTILWAIVLFAIAVYSIHAGGHGHVVEIGLSIAAVAYGCLLGVFLLGTLTRYATQTGTIIGMITGFALNIVLWQFPGKVLLSGWLYTPAANQSWAHPPAIISIPKVAFTWYVLIGSLTTFAIGSLASLLFRKQSLHRPPQGTSKRLQTKSSTATSVLLPLLLLFWLSSSQGTCFSQTPPPNPSPTTTPPSEPWALNPDPSPFTTLLNTAIAAHKLPGAVVLIGHNDHIVFEQAYGNRKLANEPGLNNQPTPAEPMTLDTIFDMASLTKCLVTATAVMQLYEQHKITSFDDPVQKYLPAFNPDHDPTRAKVTLRMLLTHTSGEPPDIDLKAPWGLNPPSKYVGLNPVDPNKQEGINLALTAPLISAPGKTFRYSDINFILLGALVEMVSGRRLDDYAYEHIFNPLSMTDTSYQPVYWPDRYLSCGNIRADPYGHPIPGSQLIRPCNMTGWFTRHLERYAPTTHDDDGDAQSNPHFGTLLRGTVNDPTARRMGGVAGHAGVFSTAHDISLFAQALLDKLLHNTGPFPLQQSTLRLMTQPQQPSTTQPQTILTQDPHAPTPTLTTTQGIPIRGFGWDINTDFSRPRGAIFPTAAPSQPTSPTPSFGHTGFTGTSLWIDPNSDTYVILLANSIHPRGNPSISHLRGDIATAAAQALNPATTSGAPGLASETWVSSEARPNPATPATPTLTGIDVLEATHFAALTPYHHLALLTNQTGLDSQGHRTIDILNTTTKLATLFSPEHGLSTNQDSTHIHQLPEDPATHLPILNLYGPKPSDKRPTHAQLANLDAVLIDLQDAGVRFYTYETLLGYFLEAASTEQLQYHHKLQIIVLDRPNPLGGQAIQGPTSDPGSESYINYMPLPLRHGLTLGELAKYIIATKHLSTALTVIPMQHWSRTQLFTNTHLPWTPPSPNLRTPTAATLYPALGLLDFTGLSVGRGSTTPFELFASCDTWFSADKVAAALNARDIPGVTFGIRPLTIADDPNHYPCHGQTFPAVHLFLADATTLDSPELGLEILSTLHHLYPTQFPLDKTLPLLASHSTLEALQRNEDPRHIAASWQPQLDAFRLARAPYLLYP